jgi:hypothetical protein
LLRRRRPISRSSGSRIPGDEVDNLRVIVVVGVVRALAASVIVAFVGFVVYVAAAFANAVTATGEPGTHLFLASTTVWVIRPVTSGGPTALAALPTATGGLLGLPGHRSTVTVGPHLRSDVDAVAARLRSTPTHTEGVQLVSIEAASDSPGGARVLAWRGEDQLRQLLFAKVPPGVGVYDVGMSRVSQLI